MGLIIFIVYGIFATMLMFKRKNITSKAVLPILFFAILGTISLGQNYTMSLISNNDGIGISNFLAKFLLPNENWTYEMFKSYFTMYLGLSITLIIVYVILIIIETRLFGPLKQNINLTQTKKHE